MYLRYEGGEQAKISVLNDSVLRFDMEPDGQFREHPAPRDESHTTTIVAKSQDEYEEEYQPSLTLSEGEDIIVETDEMQLIIDPETAMMKMVNKESGETVLEEREPLKYNDTETVQTLKSDASEYYFGGGQQNGYFSHKGRKVAVENKSTWVDGGVSSPNPFYFSSKGYGVVRHTFAQGEYDFRDEETIVLSHDEKRFDAFYFVEDSSKDILSDYVELTGQPALMPKYGFYQGNANCYNKPDEGITLTTTGVEVAKSYGEHDMPIGWFLPNDGYGCGYGGSAVVSTRDYQWKSFTPIMINMSGWSDKDKTPWVWGEPYETINRMYLKLKAQMLPYYYSYARESYDTGVPMVRALMLEYPEEEFTMGNQTQYEYLWGENLLVAPVYDEAENNAEVRNKIYLPGGEDQVWIDYFTGEQYTGGKVVNSIDAPLWKLPLFVKSGAIIPMTVENNSVQELTGEEPRIFDVYPDGDSSFTLYDDGYSQAYQNGEGSFTEITSHEQDGTADITVGKMSGSFEGMKSERETQFIVQQQDQPQSVQATVGGIEAELRKRQIGKRLRSQKATLTIMMKRRATAHIMMAQAMARRVCM